MKARRFLSRLCTALALTCSVSGALLYSAPAGADPAPAGCDCKMKKAGDPCGGMGTCAANMDCVEGCTCQKDDILGLVCKTN
jgi:hypothetical protein